MTSSQKLMKNQSRPQTMAPKFSKVYFLNPNWNLRQTHSHETNLSTKKCFHLRNPVKTTLTMILTIMMRKVKFLSPKIKALRKESKTIYQYAGSRSLTDLSSRKIQEESPEGTVFDDSVHKELVVPSYHEFLGILGDSLRTQEFYRKFRFATHPKI